MSTAPTIGKVTLAGAGPGDPELITLRALRSLQEADVVLTDRLVSPEIIHLYVPTRANIISVGKRSGRAESTSQEEINRLLVHHALAGSRVVRLKGGDVSIFSNILDELRALVEHRIPYEIIPGVSAALGAAACAGIPLTARGFATSVRFVTAYRPELVEDGYWKELAQTEDTLVFYMSAEVLTTVASRLRQHGAPADRLIAIVSQATTPEQQVAVHSLDEYAAITSPRIISPTIAIVGKVVALQQEFGWMINNASPRSYFQNIKSMVKIDGYASGV